MEASAFVFFLYFGVVMPPYLHERLMRLLDSCINEEVPLGRTWLRFHGFQGGLVWEKIKGVMRVWRNERNPLFNAKAFLESYEIENPMNEGINQARCQIQQDMLLSYLEQLPESELASIFPESGWSSEEKREFLRSSSEIISSRAMYLNGCVADVAWLHQVGALIPPTPLLNRERPSYQKTITFLQRFYAGGLNRDLSSEEIQMMIPAVTHVMSSWKPNVLLYDEAWVLQSNISGINGQCAKPSSVAADGYQNNNNNTSSSGNFSYLKNCKLASTIFHPNELMESLLSMDWIKDPVKPTGFYDWSTHFFSQAAQALSYFIHLNDISTRAESAMPVSKRRHPFMLEFILGDMHEIAERIGDRREGKMYPFRPDKFLRIYVNNVPDYCGMLSLFTKMTGLLKDECQHVATTTTAASTASTASTVEEHLNANNTEDNSSRSSVVDCVCCLNPANASAVAAKKKMTKNNNKCLVPFIESYILLNTGIWKDLEQVVFSHTLVPSLGSISRYLGIELLEGGLWQTPSKWTRACSLRSAGNSVEEATSSVKSDDVKALTMTTHSRISPTELNIWLYRVFCAICLPVPMDPQVFIREFFPNNLTTFLHLIEYLWREKLVPAHWLAQSLEAILENRISVKSVCSIIPATSPNSPVNNCSNNNNVSNCPLVKMSVAPFLLELKTLTALWLQKASLLEFPLVCPLPGSIITCECFVVPCDFKQQQQQQQQPKAPVKLPSKKKTKGRQANNTSSNGNSRSGNVSDTFSAEEMFGGHVRAPVMGLALEPLNRNGKSAIFDLPQREDESEDENGFPILYGSLLKNYLKLSDDDDDDKDDHNNDGGEVSRSQPPPIHILSVFDWLSDQNRIVFNLPADLYGYFRRNNWTLFLFRTDNWAPITRRQYFNQVFIKQQ